MTWGLYKNKTPCYIIVLGMDSHGNLTLLMAWDWRAKDIWIPSRERIREREKKEMVPQGEKEEKR